MTVRTPQNDHVLFDSAAEALGITIGSFGWLADARAALGFDRPPGPSKLGSPRCRSGSLASGGQRPYCTCDTCW